EFLGDTISDIAFEKAGIIKHSIPVVTAVSNKEALDVLKRTAKDRHAEIHIYGRDFNDAPLLMDCDHIAFDYSGFSRYSGLFVPLTGRHQIQNASLAVRACEILSRRGLSVTDDAIFRGLRNLQIEGRLETVSAKPHIIIDGAHNPEAAQALSQSMTITYPSKKIILVAGIMKDKDIMGILKPLVRIADSVILTRPDSDRAAAPEAMKEGLERIDIDRDTNSMCSISTSNTLSNALSTANNMCRDDSIILVTGSFYTAGETKDILNHKSGVLSRLRENYSSGNSN
ncbi:MAG TPA: hypothetical protein ENH40_05025, partial [Nitrospirae bacterium]|nr:hypothetical protein [Nitrospirota bacterium]